MLNQIKKNWRLFSSASGWINQNGVYKIHTTVALIRKTAC
jgi:hypothetical protein